MSKSQPWMKFYPQDWRADEKLRMCSLAARGLWIEMLAIMHRSERYGQLLISGRVPTDAQLAVQVGASPSEVTALLAELDGAGVFSRAASGAIYSRRMTRDGKKAETARKNGKAGGNPTLCKSKENPASVKGKDKGEDKVEDKLRSQKPEAREKETPSGIGGTGARPANDQPLSELETHAREIADVIHLTRPIAKADRDVLRGWLDDGLNFDFHVMPAVRDVAARELGRGKSISGFRYLDGAVREYADGWHRENERLKAIAAGGRK